MGVLIFLLFGLSSLIYGIFTLFTDAVSGIFCIAFGLLICVVTTRMLLFMRKVKKNGKELDAVVTECHVTGGKDSVTRFKCRVLSGTVSISISGKFGNKYKKDTVSKLYLNNGKYYYDDSGNMVKGTFKDL